MKLDDLKALATEKGIEFKAKVTKPELAKVLFEAEFIKKEVYDKIVLKLEAQKDLNEDTRKKVNTENTYSSEIRVKKEDVLRGTKTVEELDLKLKKIKFAYREAESKLDLKRADQLRLLLRKEIDEAGDKDALFIYLKTERAHQRIKKVDTYVLNNIEREKADKRCHNKSRISASGTHTQLGEEYDFFTYFDESEKRICDMYVIFIPKVIPPEFQIGKELAFKMSQGFMPSLSDYKDEKVLWHRLILRESEFKKYFEIIE